MANLALVFDIIGKDHASATFDKVGKSAASTGKHIEGIGAKFTGVLGTAAKLAGGLFFANSITGAVAALGELGMTYEDNLNIFKNVTKATNAEMGKIQEKARALGADLQLPGVSAAGAAAAMTELAKAGFTTQQAMDAAKGTLQLAKVGMMSEAAAAEIAGNAVNAFGIQAKDVGMVIDEMAAAANASSVDVKDMSDSFKMAAGVFSAFQGTVVGPKEAITELNTAIGILGNAGMKGSDAGTSLKQMLIQLTGPSGVAKDAMFALYATTQGVKLSQEQLDDVLRGSKKARDKATNSIREHNKQLGESGDIAFTSSGKMRPLREIIDLVAKGTKGLDDETKDLALTTIFGADASRAMINLMRGGVPAYDAMRKAVMQEGAAADAAAAQNAGLRGAFDNVKSQVENAAISIYNAVRGPLTEGLNSFAAELPGIFDKIGGFFTFLADNKEAVAAFAAEFGALFILMKVHAAFLAVEGAGGLLAYVKAMNIVQTASKAWAAIQWALNIALNANPIGLIVGLLVVLGAGLVIAYQRSDTFRTIVQAAWKGVQDGATFMWEKVLKPTFRFLVLSWITVAGAILSGAKTAFGWVPGLGPKLQEASDKFDQFKADVNKALGGIDDEPVTVSVGFKYGGPTTSKYKKPLYYMGDGYGLDSYGKGIGDGPGLDVKSVFPSMSSISTNSRNAAMAGGLDQLMSMYEDSGSSGAPAGAMKWQALWAAVRAAVPGATLNSSFRKNAITATGNRSYHALGRAIDIGPATMGTFRIVKALFPNATELIFSPAGKQQLWHGQPHMYSGVTRANHWDHVHLAMQSGGLVPGRGRGDRVPALLEPGEYVVSRPQVQRQGVAAMNALNGGTTTGTTFVFQGDVYDVGLLDRLRREQISEQRAANFRAGVTA